MGMPVYRIHIQYIRILAIYICVYVYMIYVYNIYVRTYIHLAMHFSWILSLFRMLRIYG